MIAPFCQISFTLYHVDAKIAVNVYSEAIDHYDFYEGMKDAV